MQVMPLATGSVVLVPGWHTRHVFDASSMGAAVNAFVSR